MIFSLSSGKMVDISVKEGDPRNSLPVGAVLQLNGYDNPEYVIVENQGMDERYSYNGVKYKVINLQQGMTTFKNAVDLRYLSQKVDNRIQTYITDRVMSAEEIMDAFKLAAVKTAERIREAQAKDQAKAAEREQLLTVYANLVRVEGSGKPGRVVAAINIRTELKAAFPGVKFGVRSQSFSMGNSVDVEWTDGPSREAVEAIVDKYQYGTFDGMTDSSGYKDEQFTGIFGGAKFVQTQRRLMNSGY